MLTHSHLPTLTAANALVVPRICRHHDIYLAGYQSAMYKLAGSAGVESFPPFGSFGSRRACLEELVKQIAVLEEYVSTEGPYLLGANPSAADCAVLPTAVFWMRMLPMFEGMDVGAAMGPKLTKWWQFMTTKDQVGVKVTAEISGALDGWESSGRWAPVLGAGTRDSAPRTLFDKILAKEIGSDVVYEDEIVLAFRDINPVAPSHVLIIPKRRDGLTQLQHATPEHKALLGHMMAVAVPAVVKAEQLEAYRLVVNDGEQACQSVLHLHMHVIGGKDLSWPPGA